MRVIARWSWALVLVGVMRGAAQTTVTTTGGTANAIPVFTGSSTIANSPIFISGGNVGVGTASPTTALDVSSGNVLVGGSGGDPSFVNYKSDAGVANLYFGMANTGIGSANRLTFFTNAVPGWLGGSEKMVILNSGNVGIGTTTPAQALEVNGNLQVDGSLIVPSGPNGLSITNTGTSGNVIAANFPYLSLGGSVSESLGSNFGGSNYYDSGLVSYVYAGGAGSTSNYVGLSVYAAPSGLIVNGLGNVGVGTISPQARLDVNGGVRISGGGAGLTFPDGTVQATAYTGTCTATGGDYAESVDVSGDKGEYEPGDVLVIGSDAHSDIQKSTEPYSTLVSGIYSTKPGYVGRRQQVNPKLSTGEVPMAMIGIVPTKVSAENGAIHRGDLLVSASLPGYAMKGTDRSRMIGAVVGKAMGTLASGTGVIEVLVSLQ